MAAEPQKEAPKETQKQEQRNEKPKKQKQGEQSLERNLSIFEEAGMGESADPAGLKPADENRISSNLITRTILELLLKCFDRFGKETLYRAEFG